jgi:hypothetical protein
MSEISKLFAVHTTEVIDKASLDPIDTAAALDNGYSQIVFLQVNNNPYLCAYSKTSGNTDLYSVSETEPWISPVESRIDLSGGPWDSLTTFILGNDPYLLAYRSKDGMLNFYRVTSDLSTSPPYSFYFARNTPTAGFTEISPVSSLGAQYIVGYNFDDGTVAAFSVSVTTSSSGGIPPLVAQNVWYHRWARGWTRFAFFQMGGANFFFKINTAKLNVNIDHLQDNPAAGSVEVGSFLQAQLPDALLIDVAAAVPWNDGEPYFMTYIASTGTASIYRIHADCLGWTQVSASQPVVGASLIVPFRLGDVSYALFYATEK